MTAGPEERIKQVALSIWGLSLDLPKAARANVSMEPFVLACRELSRELDKALEQLEKEKAR